MSALSPSPLLYKAHEYSYVVVYSLIIICTLLPISCFGVLITLGQLALVVLMVVHTLGRGISSKPSRLLLRTYGLLSLLVPLSSALPVANPANETGRTSHVSTPDLDLTTKPASTTTALPFVAPLHVLARLLPNHGLPVQEALDVFNMFFDFHPSIAARFPARYISDDVNLPLDDPLVPTFKQSIVDIAPSIYEAALRHTTRLVSTIQDLIANGARALEIAPRQCLPLWGTDVVQRLQPSADRLEWWHDADDFLKQFEDAAPQGAFKNSFVLAVLQARGYLLTLPHDVEVAGRGGAVHLQARDLASFLSHRWLNDDMINAGLDWLVHALGPTTTTAIANCYWLESLRSARAQGFATYALRSSRLAALLRTGRMRVLEIPLHIHGNHWAGLHVNLTDCTYSYRDGLYASAHPSQEDLDLVQWALSSLLPGPVPQLTPSTRPLVSPRQRDHHSCGILYLSTLSHELLGDQPWRQATADLWHLEWFNRLAEDAAIGSDAQSVQEEEDGKASIVELDNVTFDFEQSAYTVSLDNSERSPELEDCNNESSRPPTPPALSLPSLDSSAAWPARLRGRGSAATSSLSGWSLDTFDTDSISDFSDVSYENDELAEDSADEALYQSVHQSSSSDALAPEFPTHAESPIRAHLYDAAEQPVPPRRAAPHPEPSGHVMRLTAYFECLTPKQAAARREAHRAEDLEAAAEELKHREYRLWLEHLKKEEHVRALTRERVRRYRQQKKAAKDERCPKVSMNDVLGRIDSLPPGPSMAQVSRPYCQFKIDARENLSSRGRKRIAARDCGPWMRPAEIVKCLQCRNPHDFAALTPQVLGQYIERPRDAFPRWRPEVIQRVEARGGIRPGGHSQHCGVLSSHPELVDEILQQLIAIREAGVMITVDNARSIILGLIQHCAPQLLREVLSDGSQFVCSDAYVRRFLYHQLHWVPRRGTRAAQKTPENAGQLLWELFIRLVLSLHDAGIRHGGLYINFNQTQVVIANPSTRTFAREGDHQVIMKGSSIHSLPSPDAPRFDEALAVGLRFDLNPNNYWFSAPLMETYFEHVVVPFFTRNKAAHNYPKDQECIVLLDCWSVHRSREFRAVVRRRWPWICLCYVPGGMTGLAQPCDVGIQRPYKLAIRQGQQQHIINETLQHLRSGAVATAIRLDNRIGTLRDCAVSWFTNAWNAINQPSLVKKAFEKCIVRNGFNLSFKSLTSPAALKIVRDVSNG
ncbi:unnamed protein product [Peniophora sp. CBMAI 1063]|nr:unnamed protein product [Peniophora sp. CBMAI 1063]